MTQQLERRDPTREDEGEDEEMEDEEDAEEEDSDSGSEEAEDEAEDEEDEEPDLELRSKIEEALRASGIEPADNSEDDTEEEELMDDDQMMAIDDQLADIFRSRASEKKGGKGTESLMLMHLLALIHNFLRCQCPTRGYPLQESCS